MIIDLLHNKIVKDTITDAFAESVNDVLVPLLEDRYGDCIEAITMYEDYLADELTYEGEWYYPLTVKTVGSDSFTVWVKWAVNKKTFRNNIPYSYIGEGAIDFELASFVPAGFADKLAGRAIDYDRNAITIKVDAVTDDPLLLVGKYSQTFVDELASQITAELSRALGVTGIEKSTMELQLVFAPGTYLEHTSENVTYRRLLLVDKGCQPRDFWVKWTRLDGALGYKVSDSVNKDVIKFELGEDVSQKIREKEYRFLAGANPDKYQSAMGKKTVTEWRDITKRAIKRGDLTKVVSEVELESHATEVSDRLRALLGDMGVSATTSEPEVPTRDDSYDLVAELARSVLGESETVAEEAPEGFVFGDVEDEPPFDIEEEVTEDEAADEDVSSFAEELIAELEETETEGETDEPDAFEFSFAAEESVGDLTFEEYVEVTEESKESAPAPQAPVIDEDAIRREIEAKLRLEYETEARLRAEREAERLRLEHERLLEENERLAKLARAAEEQRIAEEEAKRAEEEARRLEEEARQREIEAKKAEEARIRAEIEAQMRLEAKERERVAEAARMAVEEQKRLEAERAERELRQREEALAREAERLRREEQARREAEERRLEAERRREEEERRRREEEEARRRVQIVTKQAKLLFRYSVDLNVIKRIKEVVEQTLVLNNKQKLNIHIKAYPQDTTSIALEIRLPQNEMDLLVSMMKALGGASLGIAKIILE